VFLLVCRHRRKGAGCTGSRNSPVVAAPGNPGVCTRGLLLAPRVRCGAARNMRVARGMPRVATARRAHRVELTRESRRRLTAEGRPREPPMHRPRDAASSRTAARKLGPRARDEELLAACCARRLEFAGRSAMAPRRGAVRRDLRASYGFARVMRSCARHAARTDRTSRAPTRTRARIVLPPPVMPSLPTRRRAQRSLSRYSPPCPATSCRSYRWTIFGPSCRWTCRTTGGAGWCGSRVCTRPSSGPPTNQ
jgi:hypothetical protein